MNSEKASFENDIDAGEAYEAATVQVVEHSIQLGQEDMDTLKNEDTLTNKVETESADIDETKKEEKKAPQSSHVTIFATAIFGNSNCSQVGSSEISALSSILKSKEHLCRNISYVNFFNLQTFRLNSGKYEHSIQVEIDVNTANLWESGRSYIFHHLGKDTWSLKDGVTISLIRIHQKR